MSAALDRGNSDSDIEIDASNHSKSSPPKAKPKAPPYKSTHKPTHGKNSDSEEENEKLLLSLADIKVHDIHVQFSR